MNQRAVFLGINCSAASLGTNSNPHQKAPSLNTKDKAGCVNSAMGQTSKDAIILFIIFPIPQITLPWSQSLLFSFRFLTVPSYHRFSDPPFSSGLLFMPLSSYNFDYRHLTIVNYSTNPVISFTNILIAQRDVLTLVMPLISCYYFIMIRKQCFQWNNNE